GFIKNGRQQATRNTGLSRVVNHRAQFGTSFQKPLESLDKFWVFLQNPWLKYGCRAQGQQTNHGANFKPLGLAVGRPEHVVEETVFLIPHPGVASYMSHRGGNPQKVFDELERHLRVVRIAERKFGSDFEHMLRE